MPSRICATDLLYSASKGARDAPTNKRGKPSFATSNTSLLWDQGQTLKISFKEDEFPAASDVEFIKYIINSHIVPLINLKIEFVSEFTEGDIRVGFNRAYGSYSYLGKDAKNVTDRAFRTLNFGWIDQSVVLHEFCHAIGAMNHEHQSPFDNPIIWNEEAVMFDMTDPESGMCVPEYSSSSNQDAMVCWTPEEVRFNILDRVTGSDLKGTTYDKYSIMHYQFYDHWLKSNGNQGSIPYNNTLSEQDKNWLRKIYPKNATEEPASSTSPATLAIIVIGGLVAAGILGGISYVAFRRLRRQKVVDNTVVDAV